MGIDEKTSALIRKIYEKSGTEQGWGEIAQDVLAATRSPLLFLSIVDLQNQHYNTTRFYGDLTGRALDGIEEYRAELYRSDPSLAYAARRPLDRFCRSRDTISGGDYLADPFVRWNESTFNTTDWTIAYSTPVDGIAFGLSLHAPADLGPFEARDEKLLRVLFDHMENAIRLKSRPPRLEGTSDAVVYLDGSGRVVDMSAFAEAQLRLHDGLWIEKHQLHAATSADAAALNGAISRALPMRHDGSCGAAVTIARPSGQAPWVVTARPLLSSLPFYLPGAAVLVRIINPSARHISPDPRRSLFGLTPREAEVADALASGSSIDELAESLGISPNTARIHVRALFKKTGTNRQADLVRTLTLAVLSLDRNGP